MEQGDKVGEGCIMLWRFILFSLPFTTSEGILGSFYLSKEVRDTSFPQELKNEGVYN